MKAYGMAVLLRNSMGIRTDVHTDDDGTDFLRIVSELDSEQIDNLRVLVEANGWKFHHKGRPAEIYPFLALVPKDGGD